MSMGISGAPPISETNLINFGSGTGNVLHVGGFGYVNSVIASGPGGLDIHVDNNGQQALARVGGGLPALTGMISPMVTGLLQQYADSGDLREDVDFQDAVEWLVGVTLNLLEPYAQRSREHRLAIVKRYVIFPLIKPATE